MRIALLMHPWQLTFRGKWTWDDIYNDPRGMSGSELGFVEIGRELVRQGHHVVAFTDTDEIWAHEMHIVPWGELQGSGEFGFDLAIAINHPGGLEHFDCPKVCLQWLNSFEYMTRAEYERVDLWLSPSEAHRRFLLGWEDVNGEYIDNAQQLSDGTVWLDPAKWSVLPLGCTPELYDGIEKVPGRVVYASSPDRGLHHLLQAWPAIKRAAPHAHLRIYYRILPWIAELKAVPEPFPPVEENRQRALFIDEALRRLSDPKWGVEVVGPVSRNGIVRAMGEAQVLAYPCDTLRWSEGFSCTTLEACAAGTTPVLFDCDALGSVYADVASIVPRGDVYTFARVVANQLAWEPSPSLKAFAREHTWKNTCEKLLALTQGLSTQPTPGPAESAASSPSEATPSETPAAASST